MYEINNQKSGPIYLSPDMYNQIQTDRLVDVKFSISALTSEEWLSWNTAISEQFKVNQIFTN